MPEFELPIGNDKWFESRDEVVQGYVEAMFFTECHGDNPELEHASVADLSSEARERICKDCMAFQALPEYRAAWAGSGDGYEFDREQAGRDLWYTRNGHGVGFWDRDEDVYGPHADMLSTTARHFGQCDLYRGDDGKLYLS